MKTLNMISLFALVFSFAFISPKLKNDNKENVIKNDIKKEKTKYNFSLKGENKILYFENNKNNNKFNNLDKDKFLKSLSNSESSGEYNIANKYKYVGKYQFGRIALKEIGYSNEKINLILNSIYFSKKENKWRFETKYFTPKEQEEAIDIFMSRLEQIYLKNEIKYYVGKKINGIKITKCGLLAGAHLGGASNVKKFLKTSGNINKKDAFNTSIGDYMKKFEDLNMTYKFTNKNKISN